MWLTEPTMLHDMEGTASCPCSSQPEPGIRRNAREFGGCLVISWEGYRVLGFGLGNFIFNGLAHCKHAFRVARSAYLAEPGHQLYNKQP